MSRVCPLSCPCRDTYRAELTVADRLEIERNHFDDNGAPILSRDDVSAAQGDVHWLDWHEAQ